MYNKVLLFELINTNIVNSKSLPNTTIFEQKYLQVSLPGIYHLVEADDNYKSYLLAMDIPETAADIISRS